MKTRARTKMRQSKPVAMTLLGGEMVLLPVREERLARLFTWAYGSTASLVEARFRVMVGAEHV